MSIEKVKILDTEINKITMSEAVAKAMRFTAEGGFHAVFTPNPEIIWAAQKDRALMEALNNADMLLPDGIGVVIASKIIGKPLPERVPGYDFVCNLLKQPGLRFFLFGGKPGVAQEAANTILSKYHAKLAGTEHGYFKDEDTPAIVEKINNSGADVLLVCLGVPKQEKWIYENRNKLSALCIGAGGTLDGLAGHVKRAPAIWQKLNLEWAYRAFREPKRIVRLFSLPLFILKVILKGVHK